MRKKLDTRFPAARIKKIMQADEDVGKIALAVPVLVSKALELFLQDLCDRTYEITLQRGAKTVSSLHLNMSMEKLGCCESFLKSSKPYFAMISLQFGYAGMNIITKISLNTGMSHYVLVVYRHAIATAVIAPFAFFFERKAQPKITFTIFMQLFILGLLGPVIDQNFYYMGLKYTSPTFSCAMSNMLPAMTFILAVLFRMEVLDVKKLWCQAKIAGTVVTVAGAMLMTIYKGPIVELFWTKYMHLQHANDTTPSSNSNDNKDFLKGSILLIFATLAWASLFVLQAKILKTYSKHQLTLTTLVCFIGTLQAVAVTFVMEHNPSAWRIGWDMNLLAAAYSGIVASSIAYYVQGIVMKKRGPVFATAFSPLMMVIVAIMGSFVLAEKIFLGGVIGAVLIVIGLYAVLWGKQKENEVTHCEMLEPTKNIDKVTEDVEANNGTEMKYSDSMLSTIVISTPATETTLKKTSQEP
ncbi:WAT1-related protein At5g07050 isoform X2 [Brassica napus]|uniref:WAT1-related protein At5g07050 isoform X2 n=1 Tax=Brassica napus TaxID=3708 RepID=UPI002078F5CB|nr:WAT1-related protein At5g07050 isoform X2 [Brassica napus]